MNVLIRGVPEATLARLDAEAKRRKMSRQELLLQLLTDWAEPPVIVGWFRPDRNGELRLAESAADDDADECVECGRPLDWPWLGVLSNGAVHGPVCSGCARSD